MKKTADALLDKCIRIVNWLYNNNIDINLSKMTHDDYLRLGYVIARRSNKNFSLTQALNDTGRSTTYYKIFAAVRYYLYDLLKAYCAEYSRADRVTKEGFNKAFDLLADRLNLLREWMLKLVVAKRLGFIGNRRQRSSKRKALRGLPDNWREQLFERAKNGKYGLAILVAALTGCRPNELCKGVTIQRTIDPQSKQATIRFDIVGAKVKENQGQPSRSITYSNNDPHPLVAVLNQHLTQRSEFVQIPNTVNFTVEIRRLAKSLWPKHKQTITAYCLRHQWSADLKAESKDGDIVSMGMGHCSAKTRRYYGVAKQSSAADKLQPLLIEAARPVKGLKRDIPSSRPTLSPY